MNHSGSQNNRRHAGPGADKNPPKQYQLPRGANEGGKANRAREKSQGKDHDVTRPVSIQYPGGERADQSVEEEVDRDGQRNRCSGPAKFLLQRDDQNAGRGSHCRRHDQGDERNARDNPSVMQLK